MKSIVPLSLFALSQAAELLSLQDFKQEVIVKTENPVIGIVT